MKTRLQRLLATRPANRQLIKREIDRVRTQDAPILNDGRYCIDAIYAGRRKQTHVAFFAGEPIHGIFARDSAHDALLACYHHHVTRWVALNAPLDVDLDKLTEWAFIRLENKDTVTIGTNVYDIGEMWA